MNLAVGLFLNTATNITNMEGLLMKLNYEYLTKVLSADALAKIEYVAATSGLDEDCVFNYAAWLVWDVSAPQFGAQLSQSDIGYETSVLVSKLNTSSGVKLINGWSA